MAPTRTTGNVRTGNERLIESLLLWLFDRLYNELAWSYDLVSWLVSGGRWARWQRAALPWIVGPRVLDVGCGPGHFLTDLIAAGFDAFGLDRSRPMQRQARRSLVGRGSLSRVVGGDALAMPFANAAFDSLVLTFPASYVQSAAFWRESGRVLREGGRVVIVEGATSNTRWWPGALEWIWSLRANERADQPILGLNDGPSRVKSLWSEAWREASTTLGGTVWLIVVVRALQENSALTDSSQ